MKYELMMILNPSLTEKELEKTQGEIKSHLGEHGFAIADEDIWGMRDLAYKVKGYTTGFYIILNFTGEAEGTIPFKKDLGLINSLLRYMLTKVDEDYILPRYDTDALSAQVSTSGRKQKLSKHAEELSKKVTTKKKEEEKPAEKEEVAKEDTKELDDKLQAIVDDADIDV